MSAIKLVATALCSSAIAAALTAWAMTAPLPKSALTIPPLLFYEEQDELVIWGAWSTTLGYDNHSTAATEVRCSKTRMSCVEGVARLLIHDEGQDLESEAFGYQIEDWSESDIKTIATRLMADCLERRLDINLSNQTAIVSWPPRASATKAIQIRLYLVSEEQEDI